MSRRVFPLALLVCAVVCPRNAHAIPTAGPPGNYVVNTPSPFDGVTFLVAGGSACSGSLLFTGLHILTAAHCVDAGVTSVTARFDVAGGPQFYLSSQIFIHPGWTGDTTGGSDIAIIELATEVDPSIPRYNIYRDIDEVGQQVHVVGYGRGADGAVGYSANPFPTGTKRAGQNEFDGDPTIFDPVNIAAGAYLFFDFDNGNAANNVSGSLGLGSQEAIVAPGDSGGPSFVIIGGIYYVIGVHAWVGTDGAPPDINAILDGTYGEIGADTRVSTYSSFIDDVLTPEPASFVLMGLGLSILFRQTIRSRSAGSRVPGCRSR